MINKISNKNKNTVRQLLKNNLIIKNTYCYYMKNMETFCALKDINMVFKNGSIYGIIGPSGGGKTTLAKVLSGRISDFHGTVRYGNMSINNYENRLHKSIVVQIITQNANNALNPTRTGWSLLKDVSTPEKIIPFLKPFHLSLEMLSRPVFSYSGGEKQRVHLLRNWLLSPSVMIFDESLSALDKEVKMNVISIMKEQKNNKIIIFITHDVEVMLNLCEELLFVFEGQIVENLKDFNIDDIYHTFCKYNENREELAQEIRKISQARKSKLTKLLETFL